MNHRVRMYVTALLATAAMAATTACGSSDGGPPEELPIVVPEGKEDNFFSRSAREYLVEGQTRIELEASADAMTEAERVALVKRLIPFKQVVVAWFLNAWLAPKDAKDKNYGYGGFSALTKNGAFEDLALKKIDRRTYQFTFRQQVAGENDLLAKLPVTRDANGQATFDLAVGKVSNADMQNLAAAAEWFRKEPWEHFDPRKAPPEIFETVRLTITPQPRSLDGWPDVNKLFADGKVTIGVHFGWDYHSQSHIKSSQKLYKWLVANGYKSPVASYDKLERTSGPFTRTVKANGKSVKIELAMFWGKPGSSTDPDTDAGGRWLKKDVIKSLETREVIVYSGHSGPFWGFSMANWNKTEEGELEDNEIKVLALPTFYQLVLAEGCETYAIGQAFFDNPAKKKRDNVDIITTTTYSTAEDADPVYDFLEAIVGTPESNVVEPWTYGELMQALDWNAWDAALYGVHGIDDAPHLHPFADPSKFCKPCARASDCGAAGNFCANLGTDGKLCTAPCTGDDGCPASYTCAPVAKGQSITGSACIPRGYKCAGAAAAPTLQLVINEIMADPPNGDDGDLNVDGWIDADEDEFVELVNPTTKALAVGGWTVADGTAVRFTFPAGTSVPAGKAVVIFGGGDVEGLEGTGAMAFVAPNKLMLANSGDTVVVRTATGVVVDRVVYGDEGGNDRSMVRSKDGDRAAGFVHHTGAVASPGLKSNGMGF